MWRLAWWPMRHSGVRAETGEAVGAAGVRKPLVWSFSWGFRLQTPGQEGSRAHFRTTAARAQAC